MIKSIKAFLQLEAAGGAVLVLVAGLAMVAANSEFAPQYQELVSPSLRFFINDILMAVFFMFVGLEIRSEIEGGSLSTRSQAILPLFAAIGGVVTPAIIYFLFNIGTDNLRGWAIPSATDIAFSLGILALFGSRLPISLKMFLLAVAVIDDLIAVLIIAVFYTASISFPDLLGAGVCVAGLFLMGKYEVTKIWIYLLIGVVLWYFIHASGVHSTIAGVIVGLLIPTKISGSLIHKLHPLTAYGIIPLFVFANAGIVLSDIHAEAFLQPITLGIATGLIIGKPLGIMFATFIMVRSGFAKLPKDARWSEFFAIAIIAGIGFTMSLFIGDLAFTNGIKMLYVKVGVMVGSITSALCGAVLLAVINRRYKTIK